MSDKDPKLPVATPVEPNIQHENTSHNRIEETNKKKKQCLILF